MAESDPWKQFPLIGAHEHPSADEILEKQGADFSLKGKTALVTGASSGIGVETVRALASKGAKVFVAVRDVEKTKKVLAEIAAAHPNNGGLEIVRIELDSLESVNAGANDFLKRTSQLNILINNAGVMACPYQTTKDGHEYQFGVNHLSHFLLFHKVQPLLLKSSTPEFQSRVVNLSSWGHHFSNIDLTDLHFTKRGYVPFTAYGQSKTSNILMAREIEHRYGNQGIHAWAVHPGGIATELGRHLSVKDLQAMGFFNEKGEYIGDNKLKSVPQGAATTVWAAVGKDLEGKGGLYLEDAKISEPSQGGALNSKHGGHTAYAYDEVAANALWEYSEKVIAPFLKD